MAARGLRCDYAAMHGVLASWITQLTACHCQHDAVTDIMWITLQAHLASQVQTSGGLQLWQMPLCSMSRPEHTGDLPLHLPMLAYNSQGVPVLFDSRGMELAPARPGAEAGLQRQLPASSHLCPPQHLGSAGLQQGHQRAGAPAAGDGAPDGQPQHPGLSNLLHELHLAQNQLHQTGQAGGVAQGPAQQQESAALPADWAPEARQVAGPPCEAEEPEGQAAAAAGRVMKAQAPQLPVSAPQEAAAQGTPLMQVTHAHGLAALQGGIVSSQHCRMPMCMQCLR